MAIQIEQLEGRVLLAGNPLGVEKVSYLGGTQLKITGTAAADAISVGRTSTGVLIKNGVEWSRRISGTFKSLLIDGGAGKDSIRVDGAILQEAIVHGGAGDDVIFGGGGNDKLYGEGGTDTLKGEAGDDILNGGSGIAYLYGGDGADRLNYDPTASDIFVVGNSLAPSILDGDAGTDTLNISTGRQSWRSTARPRRRARKSS